MRMWIAFMKAMESDIYNSNILKNIKQEQLEDENEFKSDEECNLMDSNMYWMDLLIKNEESSPDVTTKTFENEDEIQTEKSTIYRQTNVLRDESEDEFSSENGDLFINEEYSLLTMTEIVGNEMGMETEIGGASGEDSLMKNQVITRHTGMFENGDGIQKRNGNIFVQSNMTEILNKNREIDQKLEECNSNSHRLIYRLHSLYQIMKNGISTDRAALSSEIADTRCAVTYTGKNVSLQPVNFCFVAEPKKILEPQFSTLEWPQLPALNGTTPTLGNVPAQYPYRTMPGEDLGRDIPNSQLPTPSNPEQYQVKTEADAETIETGNLAAQYPDWTACGEDQSRDIQNNTFPTFLNPKEYQDKTEIRVETKSAGNSCTMLSEKEAEDRMQTEHGSCFIKNGMSDLSDVFIKKEVEDDIFEEYLGNSLCKKMKYELIPGPELSFATDSFDFTPNLDVRDIPLPPGSPPKQALALQSSNSCLSPLPIVIQTEPTFCDDIPVCQNLEQNKQEEVESLKEIEDEKLKESSDPSSSAVSSEQELEAVVQSETASNFEENAMTDLLKENGENKPKLETSDDSIYLPFNREVYEPTGASDALSPSIKDVANILLHSGDPPPLLLPPGAVPLRPPPRPQDSPVVIALADRLFNTPREERHNFVWDDEALLEFRDLVEQCGYRRLRCRLTSSDGRTMWVTVPKYKVVELVAAKERSNEQDEDTEESEISSQEDTSTPESHTAVPCQEQSQCNSS